LSVFEEGSAYADFVDGLEPFPAETVITKQYASAFFGTPLASSLTAQSIDTVIICGVTTSGCIRASAVDAVQHGFLPVVVREAVGDRDEAPHEANLFDLQAKYADVVPMNDVLAYLGALNSEPPA
jgi:maleamate amidohydrolase